jgi:hypothetical protein
MMQTVDSASSDAIACLMAQSDPAELPRRRARPVNPGLRVLQRTGTDQVSWQSMGDRW